MGHCIIDFDFDLGDIIGFLPKNFAKLGIYVSYTPHGAVFSRNLTQVMVRRLHEQFQGSKDFFHELDKLDPLSCHMQLETDDDEKLREQLVELTDTMADTPGLDLCHRWVENKLVLADTEAELHILDDDEQFDKD